MLITDTPPAEPASAMGDPGLRWLAAVILLIVASLAALPFVSSREADATMTALKAVADKERVYDRLLGLLKDAETGQRGYVITGDGAFLAPYDNATLEIPDALRALPPLAESPAEQAALAEIERLSHLKLEELAATVALRREQGLEAAAAKVRDRLGKTYMDRLRVLIGEQVDTLERRRHALRDRLRTTLGYNIVLGIAASVASALVIGIALYVATRTLRERAQAAAQAHQLAEAQAEQARQSHARSQRLADTALMLQAMDSLTGAGELREVLPAFLPKLLPGSAGAVYLYRNSRDFLQRAATWGGDGHHPDLVGADQCWGLRFGRVHVAGNGDGMHCAHCAATSPAAGRTNLCVPMISQGEVLGLLVASVSAGPEAALDQAAATAISEQLALGASNINLREVLRRQSTTDELTGLYNRRWFDETLRRELFRAERKRAALAVVMIDLDHFKRFNDTHGHIAGDTALCAAAGVIRAGLRPTDFAVRYGGEEMMAILPATPQTQAVTVAERLCARMREAVVFDDMRLALPHVTGSFGVATLLPGQDERSLIEAADAALYRAKEAGRDRIGT